MAESDVTSSQWEDYFNTYQWSLKVTRANLAWTPSNGGAGETVCVLDTGVDPGHNDLVGRVDPTKAVSVIAVPRFASDVTVLDYQIHGTFVSAQITSNGIGTASVAPNASLCALKVMSQDGRGTFGDIIFGIYYAATLGADVISMDDIKAAASPLPSSPAPAPSSSPTWGPCPSGSSRPAS